MLRYQRMKGFIDIVCLVLSLPNLFAGMAFLVLKHTFAMRDPLQKGAGGEGSGWGWSHIYIFASRLSFEKLRR